MKLWLAGRRAAIKSHWGTVARFRTHSMELTPCQSRLARQVGAPFALITTTSFITPPMDWPRAASRTTRPSNNCCPLQQCCRSNLSSARHRLSSSGRFRAASNDCLKEQAALMELTAILRIALRALARNKMRSALTMLGIIIGVAAVIATVGVGQGAQEQVQQQIASMGSNVLYISAGSVNRGGLRMGWGATKTLIYADEQAFLRECPAVANAAATTGTQAQVVFGNDNWFTRVTGTEPQYIDIRTWALAEGDFFTKSDNDIAANVAVIGETVRKNLFGATDPVGQTIRIKNLPFKVVGLLIPKGQSAGG